jgi:acetyltransferase-like isoleucine patch superfamily enzyme
MLLRAIQAWDRLRLARQMRRHAGLCIDPAASSNLACARYDLGAGASLRIGPGVVTERVEGRLHFHLEPGASVEIGAGTWLRTTLAEVHLVAFSGASLRLGPDCFLNGSHLSAKRELVLGRRAWVGPGTRIFDSDQHDFDAERPERSEPVKIGDHVWIAGDCTVLRGVSIGDHAVVGARSVVTRDVPAHTLVLGAPAQPRGAVGDRSRTR